MHSASPQRLSLPSALLATAGEKKPRGRGRRLRGPDFCNVRIISKPKKENLNSKSVTFADDVQELVVDCGMAPPHEEISEKRIASVFPARYPEYFCQYASASVSPNTSPSTSLLPFKRNGK